MADPTRQSVLFPALLDKPVHVGFDEPLVTSDGGTLLVKAVDETLGLTASLMGGLSDRRQASKVQHSGLDLFRQRVFGLVCGYADVNDVARIGRDPLHKCLLGRDPLADADLASQPTLSRFENAMTQADLLRMSDTLLDVVLDRHRRRLRRVRRVTIDMDPTVDPTHGQQELAFYNGHYRSWCYQPMPCFVTFGQESEQYLVAAALRPGTAPAKQGAIAVLRRVIEALRGRFRRARILVRLDGGFSSPEIFTFLEEQGVDYVVAMARNKVLERPSRRLLGTARRRSRESGQSEALFGETRYAARSWKKRKRRVIYKAEVVRLGERKPRDNCRYVITNLRLRPENVYKVYRQRGDVENRIKALKDDLYLDRTSCSRFLANQLRVLMTATAYVLLQELRLKLVRTPMAAAQVATLRLRLLKIGGRVQRSVRRICLHLSANHPWAVDWTTAARAVGALSP
jgi:hypothetical protein